MATISSTFQTARTFQNGYRLMDVVDSGKWNSGLSKIKFLRLGGPVLSGVENVKDKLQHCCKLTKGNVSVQAHWPIRLSRVRTSATSFHPDKEIEDIYE